MVLWYGYYGNYFKRETYGVFQKSKLLPSLSLPSSRVIQDKHKAKDCRSDNYCANWLAMINMVNL